MKTRSLTPRAALLAIALAACLEPATAARYTYHGDLLDGDTPADGVFDLRVRALASPQAAKSLAPATELPAVAVVDGRFSVELDLPDTGLSTMYVEVAVREKDGGDYEVLGDPRPVAKANSACSGAWALDGNTGVPTGSFLGIADPASQAALVLRARNSAIARFIPAGTEADFGEAPRIALGAPTNLVIGTGATVGGGGSTRDGTGAFCGICSNNATAEFSTIAGGRGNNASGRGSAVGGGVSNQAAGDLSTVGAGAANLATADYAFVGGGAENGALGSFAAVSGGQANLATGSSAAVPGGVGNRAAGAQSLAAGANSCAGGLSSIALGDQAEVRAGDGLSNDGCSSGLTSGDANGDEGTFAYADTGTTPFRSSGPNQFIVRARGGVGINTAPPVGSVEMTIQSDADEGDFANLWLKQRSANANGVMLSVGDGGGTNNAAFYIDHYTGNAQARRLELLGTGAVTIRSNVTQANTGVTMAANAGSWSSLSDRRLKTAIEAVDPEDVLARLLATPVSTWSYIAQGRDVRHIGPMAQDFAAAFEVGENDTTISSIDADGVALAAIQGLDRKLARENAELRETVAQLAARLARLEAAAGRSP